MRWQWGELWCITIIYCMWLQYRMQWGRRQRSAGAEVGHYVSATLCLSSAKISEVLSGRPNLVLSAFYRTLPPIISYGVCTHHTWAYRYHSYQCIHTGIWSTDTWALQSTMNDLSVEHRIDGWCERGCQGNRGKIGRSGWSKCVAQRSPVVPVLSPSRNPRFWTPLHWPHPFLFCSPRLESRSRPPSRVNKVHGPIS